MWWCPALTTAEPQEQSEKGRASPCTIYKTDASVAKVRGAPPLFSAPCPRRGSSREDKAIGSPLQIWALSEIEPAVKIAHSGAGHHCAHCVVRGLFVNPQSHTTCHNAQHRFWVTSAAAQRVALRAVAAAATVAMATAAAIAAPAATFPHTHLRHLRHIRHRREEAAADPVAPQGRAGRDRAPL